MMHTRDKEDPIPVGIGINTHNVKFADNRY